MLTNKCPVAWHIAHTDHSSCLLAMATKTVPACSNSQILSINFFKEVCGEQSGEFECGY